MPAAEELREAGLEFVREPSGGQPEVEAGVDKVDDLTVVEDASGIRN